MSHIFTERSHLEVLRRLDMHSVFRRRGVMRGRQSLMAPFGSVDHSGV